MGLLDLFAARRQASDSIVVKGEDTRWLRKCHDALCAAAFQNIQSNPTIKRITADYKRWAAWGTLRLALSQNTSGTTINVEVEAYYNLGAVMACHDPANFILDRFRDQLK